MSADGSTALVVEVPEAEPVVAAHRLRFDASAPLGVPAHVTVLYPFVPAPAVDAHLLDTLTDLFARCRSFAYRFSDTAWFDAEVLFLAPDAPADFTALTDAAAAAFPDHPPYGGVFDEVVPHLTVAHDTELELMQAAAAEIGPQLPVTGSATAVTLLRQNGAGGRWERHARFPLGDGLTA